MPPPGRRDDLGQLRGAASGCSGPACVGASDRFLAGGIVQAGWGVATCFRTAGRHAAPGPGRASGLPGSPRAGTGRDGGRLPGREPDDGAEGGPEGRQLAPVEPQGGSGSVPPRDPRRWRSSTPQHRHRLLGHARRREHRLLDAVRRGLRPGQARGEEWPVVGGARMQLCVSGCAGVAARARAMAWCTATSSRAT